MSIIENLDVVDTLYKRNYLEQTVLVKVAANYRVFKLFKEKFKVPIM